MADENTVVERLEIQLGYADFIASLKSMTNAYHSAIDQMTNLGAGIGKNIIQANKFVQNSINSLTSDTANAIRKSFGQVDTSFNTTNANIRKLTNQATADLRALDIIAAKRGKIIAEGQVKIAETETIGRIAGKSKTNIDYGIDQVIAKTNEKLKVLDDKAAAIQSKMYGRLSQLGVQTAETISASTKNISGSVVAIANESTSKLQGMFKTTGDLNKDLQTIVSGKETINEIKQQRTNLEKELKDLDAQRINAQKAVDLSLVALNKQTNQEMYQDAFVNHQKAASEFTKITEQQEIATVAHKKLGDELANAYARLPQALTNVKEQFGENYRAIIKSAESTTAGFKERLAEMNAQIERVGITKVNLTGYFKEFEQFKLQLKGNIEALDQFILKLSKIKSVDPDISNVINDFKALRTNIANQHKEVSDTIKNTNRNFREALGDEMRAFTSSTMNMFRNFRWQVVTMVYLTQMAVQGIKSVLFNIFKEIDEYRQHIYAITATIGMNIDPNMFQNRFTEIFSYARNLMDKLQAESGKTYASLEDMIMVTRSFTQAGVFPKTQEDVAKIGTLATAVKVMTEGMANAGVQMRQEIMALIEGRARVTDTLARMLKLHGIDIKKAMDEWEKTGVDKLTGLSKLFESFAEVNKHITNEYSVQIKRLETTWNWIKRIAGESLTLKVAQDIDKLTTSLGDLSTNKLTDFGKDIMISVRTGLIIIYETLKSIGSALIQIFSSAMGITNQFNILAYGVDKGYESLSTWERSMVDFLVALYAVETVIKRLAWAFEYLGNLATRIALLFKAIFLIDITKPKEALDIFNQIDELEKKIWESRTRIERDYENKTGGVVNVVKQLQREMGGLNDEVKNSINTELNYSSAIMQVIKNLTELEVLDKKYKPKEEKISTDQKEVRESWIKTMSVINEQLKILEKSAIENEQKLSNGMVNVSQVVGEEVKNVSDEMVKSVETDVSFATKIWQGFTNFMTSSRVDFWNIAKSTASVAAVSNLGMPGMKEFEKARILKGVIERENEKQYDDNVMKTKDRTAKLNKLVDQTNKEHAKTNQDMINKLNAGQKTVIDMWDQYVGLLEKFATINPYEKLTIDYQKHLADIDKAAQDNSIVKSRLIELQGLAEKNWLNQLYQKEQDINLELTNFTRKIFGIEATPIQKITDDFSRLGAEINKNKDLLGIQEEFLAVYYGDIPQNIQEAIDKQRKWLDLLKEELPIQEELSKQRQKIKEDIELRIKQLEVVDAYTKALELSTSTIDKQSSAVLKLQKEYTAWNLQQQLSLNEAQAKAQSEVLRNTMELKLGNVGNYSEEYQKQFDKQKEIFNQSNIYMKEALDEQIKEVWYPFYKDLKDMQQSWADSISSTFTDILFDATDMTTKIKDLLTTMGKEVVNAFIKREVVEPLLNNVMTPMIKGIGSMLPLPAGIGEMFGIGGEVKFNALSDITDSNPLPVKIISGVKGVTEDATKALSDLAKNPSLFSGGVFGNLPSTYFEDFYKSISSSKDIVNESIDSITGLSNTAIETTTSFGDLNNSTFSLTNSFLNSASSISNLLSGGGGGFFSSLFSAIGGGGGSGLIEGSILSEASFIGMAGGGEIKEPVFGVGLNTGTHYKFGEEGPETVTPSNKKSDFNPNIKFEIQNNTGRDVSMEQSGTPYVKDEQYIIGVVLKATKNRPDFGRTLNRNISRRT